MSRNVVKFKDKDNNEYDVKDAAAREALENKADIDGYYEAMTVGDAEQLVATVGVEDKVPYNFRTAGGSADIGDREVDQLVGGTVAWNQLTPNANSHIELSSSLSWNDISNAKFSLISGHKYLISLVGKTVSGGNLRIRDQTEGIVGSSSPYQFVYSSQNTTNDTTSIQGNWSEGTTDAYLNVFDLTQMFGSTIADYIYSLETANAGSGVAWFRKLFPKDYYAYDAGSLQSVQAKSHVMTGFNAYNNSTGKAKVVGGMVYQITGTYTALSLNGTTITPDASGYFTPAENGEITVTGGNTTDTCIHLKWDGERDGEYEAYNEHVYELDDDLVLRGIPKKDTNNKLYYDGDVYASDGTVKRKYREYTIKDSDLSYYPYSLTYITAVVIKNLINMKMSQTKLAIHDKFGLVSKPYPLDAVSNIGKLVNATENSFWFCFESGTTLEQAKAALVGTKILYELATPTTESADPYQNPQIVDDWGTEEYVDAGVTASTPTRDVAIPVGHETIYRQNLRAKLEMSPDSPDSNGDYLMRHSNGGNEYVAYESPVPSLPSEDGTYTLKCTVSGSSKTLSWVADT